EMGLKTTYYLRTLGASQIEKSTLDASKYGYTQKRVYKPGSGEAAAESAAGAREAQAAEQAQAQAATGTEGGASSTEGGEQWLSTFKPATQVDSICTLTDPDCESCQ
ncbi:MAG: hypothetical protein ACLFQZ_11565, partial [Spirochaetaceae bacterium]